MSLFFLVLTEILYHGRRAYTATSLTVLYGVQSNPNPAGVYETAR